jgi:hypothetical protein
LLKESCAGGWRVRPETPRRRICAIEKLKALRPEQGAEVEDFVDFLHSREGDRRLVETAATTTEPRWSLDVTGDLDMTRARRAGVDAKRVSVDFPSWMVRSLDQEATRLGVTRQSLIKMWLAERLGKQKVVSSR